MNSNLVDWSVSADNIEGNLWRITVTGNIEDGYHIYDTAEYDYGANPTVISFDLGNKVSLSGDLQVLCDVHKEYDEILGFELGTISGTAEFSQDVILSGRKADVLVNVEWMACNETSCSPLDDVSLSVHLERESHSPSYYWGYGCGILSAVILAAVALNIAGKKKIKK